MPLGCLPDALRPAVIQTHDDLAAYITEIVLAMFDGDQLRSLPDQLQPFQGLADLLTVRRTVLTQMRYVADVATSFPSKTYSTSKGLFRLVWRQCRRSGTDTQTPHSFSLCPAAGSGLLSDSGSSRSELASILLFEQHPSACCCLAAKWQLDVAYTPSKTFARWCMTRLTCGRMSPGLCSSEHFEPLADSTVSPCDAN